MADATPKTPGTRTADPLLALLLGWAVPGAGHLLVGQVKKGIFFFVVLLLTFVAGLLLADFRTVRMSDNPFYFVGQIGSGLNLLLTSVCTDLRPRGWVSQLYFEPGLLYMSVSGLLNILVMMAIFPPPEPAAKPAAQEKKDAVQSADPSAADAAPETKG